MWTNCNWITHIIDHIGLFLNKNELIHNNCAGLIICLEPLFTVERVAWWEFFSNSTPRDSNYILIIKYIHIKSKKKKSEDCKYDFMLRLITLILIRTGHRTMCENALFVVTDCWQIKCLLCVLQRCHNYMTDQLGIPVWGSYVIFGLATLFSGLALGLVSPLQHLFMIFRSSESAGDAPAVFTDFSCKQCQ